MTEVDVANSDFLGVVESVAEHCGVIGITTRVAEHNVQPTCGVYLTTPSFVQACIVFLHYIFIYLLYMSARYAGKSPRTLSQDALQYY